MISDWKAVPIVSRLATASFQPALEIERQTPISPGPGTLVGRTAMSRHVARIDDAWTDPLYEKKEDAKIGGHRSMIGVPLMREGEPVGVIGLSRSRVDPFWDVKSSWCEPSPTRR